MLQGGITVDAHRFCFVEVLTGPSFPSTTPTEPATLCVCFPISVVLSGGTLMLQGAGSRRHWNQRGGVHSFEDDGYCSIREEETGVADHTEPTLIMESQQVLSQKRDDVQQSLSFAHQVFLQTTCWRQSVFVVCLVLFFVTRALIFCLRVTFLCMSCCKNQL